MAEKGSVMNVRDYLKENIVILDGGMGTLLQAAGLKPGESPERWNITHPEIIAGIHRDYFDAGTNVVNTNTFGANILHFDETELEEIVKAAIANARDAIALSESKHDSALRGADYVAAQEKFVAIDVGPCGRLLKPYGDLDFEDAVNVFKKTIELGAKYGADLVMIETMNDSYETKAALLAAKESCDLPVFVSNAYSEDGKLMTGATPEAMVAMLEGMRADAIGTNCSLGPHQLSGVVEKLLRYSSTPILFKPNAGLPVARDGKTCFDITADDFADEVLRQVHEGVRIVGGCCGTTPEYIKAVVDRIGQFEPLPIEFKPETLCSSYTHTVEIGNGPILIGERLNPTGKKIFKKALIDHDIDYVLGEGLKQADAGVHLLDVNVGLPEVDEPALLKEVVCELQAVTDLPLTIDTSDPIAMEQALRVYNGKAVINSVNGKDEVMDTIFPLAAKYGGVVIALTLDEDGIPATSRERVAIAERIVKRAAEYGIAKKNLMFDTLAMTISADTQAAIATLGSLHEIRNRMGINTSLGVSNISFGLPERDLINGTFFAIAMDKGLSAAIMNPYSAEMMKSYYTFRALNDLDDNCMDYIDFAGRHQAQKAALEAKVKAASETVQASNDSKDDVNTSELSELMQAIVKGLKERSASLAQSLIETGRKPLDIVQEEVIPALNVVGEGFEKKKFYLPQLLMSAESAKEAFAVIKEAMVKSEGDESKGDSDRQSTGTKVVIATVKGDIHDIGKNIVKLLLENYGFDVIDLGKDVAPEAILDAVTANRARICGLSALMTTTVPAMEETIKLIHAEAPFCKVMVGGAVLTQEYADRISADGYSKDAMGAVRYALSECE